MLCTCPGQKATFLCLQEGGPVSAIMSRLLGEGRNFNSGTFCFLRQMKDTAAGQGSKVYEKGGEHRCTLRSDWGLQPGLLLTVSRQESTTKTVSAVVWFPLESFQTPSSGF